MAGVAVEGEDMEAVCLDHEGHERHEGHETPLVFVTFASIVFFVVAFRVVLSPMTW
jgi:hypothetical protein